MLRLGWVTLLMLETTEEDTYDGCRLTYLIPES